jgi:hypothetical protein
MRWGVGLTSAASARASASRGSDATAELDRRLRHDLKPLLAESFVEAGKDVAVVANGADFVFPALDQHVSLEQAIDAPNYHGRLSISRIRAGRLKFSILRGRSLLPMCRPSDLFLGNEFRPPLHDNFSVFDLRQSDSAAQLRRASFIRSDGVQTTTGTNSSCTKARA